MDEFITVVMTQYIKSIKTEDTGGGIQNDIIELNNGFVLILTSGAIFGYRSRADYEAGEDPELTVITD